MPAFEAFPSMPFWQDLAVSDTQKAAYFTPTYSGGKSGRQAPQAAARIVLLAKMGCRWQASSQLMVPQVACG